MNEHLLENLHMRNKFTTAKLAVNIEKATQQYSIIYNLLLQCVLTFIILVALCKMVRQISNIFQF